MVGIRPIDGVRLVGALLLVALATRAEAGGAAVRWMPSTDPRVVGYHVYMRPAGTPYGSPIYTGKPSPAADGSLTYTASGLTSGQTYFFAVTAYATTGLESGISGEMALGAANPCAVDQCSSPSSCNIYFAADGSSCDDGQFCNGIDVCQGGVCQKGAPPNCNDGVACTSDSCDEALKRCRHVSQSGCCQVDADCVDNDVCTTSERCISGTCASFATTCPSTPCAEAYCDPQFGCGVMPLPNGVSCSIACDLLTTRRLLMRPDPLGVSFTLKATFETTSAIDPTTTGVTVEVADGVGTILYSAAIPAAAIIGARGTKFSYLAHDDGSATNGLTALVLKVHRGRWSVRARGVAPALDDAIAQSQLQVTVRFQSTCAEDTTLVCSGDPTHSASCR